MGERILSDNTTQDIILNCDKRAIGLNMYKNEVTT